MGPPELYASLEHWIQSEKFRGVDEEFRQYLMILPTPREVRKAALRKDALVSEDWVRRQNRIMAAGIWMKVAQNEDVRHCLLAQTSFANAYTFNDHYWGSSRPNVSIGFYARLLGWIQRRLQKGARRLGVIGTKNFSNAFLHQVKLDALFLNGEPNEVICGQGPRLDSFTESWAMNRYIPITHRPELNSMHLTTRLAAYHALANDVSHLVVFRQGHLEGFEVLVERARHNGTAVRLIDLDEDGKPKKKALGRASNTTQHRKT